MQILIYSFTQTASCEELTLWKRSWCWKGLGAGGEGDDRGWDRWMASPTRWTWVWVNSGTWWWTGRPGVLHFMGSQRVGHNWATELNWIQTVYTHVFWTRRRGKDKGWWGDEGHKLWSGLIAQICTVFLLMWLCDWLAPQPTDSWEDCFKNLKEYL